MIIIIYVMYFHFGLRDCVVLLYSFSRNSGSGTQSVEVLPANERTQLRWNGNPFLLDREGSSNEMDPGPWLLPYWMARWTGML